MSLARKMAFLSGGAWLLIAVAMFTLVLRSGPEAFGGEENEGTRSVAAAIILPGYLLNFALMFRTRRGRRRGELDERDKAVERQASAVAMIVMLLAFFLACIALFDHYQAAGAVPVGWLWILAYGAVAGVSALHPLVSLVVDYSGRADA